MTELDEAMLLHMASIVFQEHRPFCFRDFLEFEVGGQVYRPKYGTIRNHFMALKKENKLELAFHSVLAFYTLPGVKFAKNSMMTPDRMGVARSGPHSRAGKTIQDEIERLPFGGRALHDIRFRFTVKDVWAFLSTNSKYKINSVSKDIAIPPWQSKDGLLEIRVTVHKTDVVSVIIGCSMSPIAADVNGVIRLSNELTRIEERLAAEIAESAKPSGAQSVAISVPEHPTWLVTHFHLGRDSLTEYAGQRFNLSWDDLEDNLVRVYSKEMKEQGTRVRVEAIATPQKTFAEVVDKLLYH